MKENLALLRGHSFLTSHCSNNELHEYFKMSSLSCWWPWPTHSRVQTTWSWNSLNYFPTCGWSQENKGIHFLKRHLLIVNILYFLNFLNLNAQVGIFWDKPFLGHHWDHLWSNDLHPMEPVCQFDNAGPPQLPRELWFPNLQCSWYTIHSDSVVVINIEMFIELEKSCHLCFSCKIFWYSFHWFFWGPYLWKYFFTLIEAWSTIAVRALPFLSVTEEPGLVWVATEKQWADSSQAQELESESQV